MRPLRLTMQAFGPYATVVELDFRELEGRSLFLIHGPTGAGKTTILDAMCFALFGVAAGTDRKSRDVRSHFAEPTLATEVQLEFLLGAARWRVRRVAEQMRPGGATMKPPQASLERIADDGSAVLKASKVREVDAEISALLGFEVEQFRQVVLLPQGEFRRLLVSDSKDREKILEMLFGAELYRRIESELKRAGAALEREVAEGRTRIDGLLRVAEAASIEEYRRDFERQGAHRIELDALGAALREQSAAAVLALAGAEKTAAACKEQSAARTALDALEKESTSQETRRRELADARRAQSLETVVQSLANTRAVHDKEQRKHTNAASHRVTAETEASNAALALAAEEARLGERDQLAALVQRLEQAVAVAGRLADLKAAIAATESRIDDGNGALSLNGRDIAYAEGRMDAGNEELRVLRPLAADVERRRSRVTDSRRRMESAKQLETVRSFLLRQSVEVGGAKQRFAEAETAVERAAAFETAKLQSWSDGQAALLAATLADGNPCPVCGASEHPSPADAGAAEVASQHDVDAARAATAATRAALETRRRELEKENTKEAELRSSIAALEGALGEDAGCSLQEATAAFTAAENELVAAGKAHARMFDLEKEQAAHLAAIEEAKLEQAATQQRLAAEKESLASSRATATELEKSVPADLAGADPAALLADAVKRAAAAATGFDRAKTRAAASTAAHSAADAAAKAATASLHETEVAVTAAAADLERALGEAGFATAAELDAARRSAAEIDALEAALRRFNEALASARARAERADAAAEGSSMPDLEALREQAERARGLLDANLDENARVQQSLVAMTKHLEALGEWTARIEDAERRYLAVGKVAAVAEGRNESGISFARFVLATLLDDVLAAATERLLRMSHGRFALVRADDRRDRRRSGGLDLEVLDAHTGVARPAATLSGGESFLASLSLALGLADVVQSHTGGIRLETMFVDEGFGTLDPEALDLAMRALEDLQAGGRLVGIISHVPELKERVGARLEVTASRTGSTARFVH